MRSLIARQRGDDDGNEIKREFKRHTSKLMIQLIQHEPESRREWLKLGIDSLDIETFEEENIPHLTRWDNDYFLANQLITKEFVNGQNIPELKSLAESFNRRVELEIIWK